MKVAKYATVLLLSACLLFTGNCMAQYLSNDMMGSPIHTLAYENVNGSPYLSDVWEAGTAKLKKGLTYKENVFLKYNMMDDELYFKSKTGDPLLFVDAVSEFTINSKTGEKHYKSGYNIDGYTDRSFFEILADGSAQLLKKNKKVIIENKQYNSASVDKSFDDVSKYYVLLNGKATQVKKDKKSILTALGNKQTELEAYIKKESLNLKNDADLAKLFIYYNSL